MGITSWIFFFCVSPAAERKARVKLLWLEMDSPSVRSLHMILHCRSMSWEITKPFTTYGSSFTYTSFSRSIPTQSGFLAPSVHQQLKSRAPVLGCSLQTKRLQATTQNRSSGNPFPCSFVRIRQLLGYTIRISLLQNVFNINTSRQEYW